MKVEDFLQKIRPLIEEGKLNLIPRRKNRNSMRKYGITVIDLENIIVNLTSKDLHKGPIIDRDIPQEYLWVFKKNIDVEGIEQEVIFYIKIKLKTDNVVCISFHEDE